MMLTEIKSTSANQYRMRQAFVGPSTDKTEKNNKKKHQPDIYNRRLYTPPCGVPFVYTIACVRWRDEERDLEAMIPFRTTEFSTIFA
jgi:hypothetical protein